MEFLGRRGWRRMTGGMLLVVAALPAMAGQNGAVIQLSQAPGREIGIACRFLDPEQSPVPPEAFLLCDAAAGLVARKAAGYGKAVVRLGLRPVIPDAGPANDGTPAVDGPILLLVIEGRQGWSGTVHARLLLSARPVRDGMAAPSVGLPPVPVELGGGHWRVAADRALDRVIGFALREE